MINLESLESAMPYICIGLPLLIGAGIFSAITYEMGQDKLFGLKSGKHALGFARDLVTKVDVRDLAKTIYRTSRNRSDSTLENKYPSIIEEHFI
jgi:hypothetical protein